MENERKQAEIKIEITDEVEMTGTNPADKVSLVEQRLLAVDLLLRDIESDFGLWTTTMVDDNARLLCLGLKHKIAKFRKAFDDDLMEPGISYSVVGSFAHCFGDNFKEVLLVPELRKSFSEITDGNVTEPEFAEFLAEFRSTNLIPDRFEGE